MANEFIIKNGYFSQGSSDVTGSLTVTAGVTASLQGTASNAVTASFAPNFANTDLTLTGDRTHILGSSVLSIGSSDPNDPAVGYLRLAPTSAKLGYSSSGAIQFNGAGTTITGPGGEDLLLSSVGYTFNQGGSDLDFTIKTSTSAAFLKIDSGLGRLGINKGALAPNNTFDINGNTIITGSLNVTADITASLQGTASFATSASNALTASFVNPLQQDVLITGSLIVSSSGAVNGLRVGTNSLIISGSQIAIGKTISNLNNPTVDIAGDLIVSGSGATDGIKSNLGIRVGNSITNPSNASAAVQGYGADYGGYFSAYSQTAGVGVYGYSSDDGSEFASSDTIGGKFEAAPPTAGFPYAVQLVDGTQDVGKVLVSQTATGKANWSTRLSGSYEITGSLAVSGSIKGQSGNTISSDAMLQATLLYLSNNF